MLYGSATELSEPPNTKQPCCFFVFDDGIVAIRPPKGSVTHSLNEAINIQAITYVYLLGSELLKQKPDTSAELFASVMGHTRDQAGKTIQTEAILVSDIVSAEIAKDGFFGAKATIRMEGR